MKKKKEKKGVVVFAAAAAAGFWLFRLWLLQALELFVHPIFFFFFNQKAQPTTTSVCACLRACMHDVEAKGVGLDRHRQETRQCTIQRSSHEPLTGNTPKIFSSFFLGENTIFPSRADYFSHCNN